MRVDEKSQEGDNIRKHDSWIPKSYKDNMKVTVPMSSFRLGKRKQNLKLPAGLNHVISFVTLSILENRPFSNCSSTRSLQTQLQKKLLMELSKLGSRKSLLVCLKTEVVRKNGTI